MAKYTIVPTSGPRRRKRPAFRWTLVALPDGFTDGDPMPLVDPSWLSYDSLADANEALRHRLEEEVLGLHGRVGTDRPPPDHAPVGPAPAGGRAGDHLDVASCVGGPGPPVLFDAHHRHLLGHAPVAPACSPRPTRRRGGPQPSETPRAWDGSRSTPRPRRVPPIACPAGGVPPTPHPRP